MSAPAKDDELIKDGKLRCPDCGSDQVRISDVTGQCRACGSSFFVG